MTEALRWQGTPFQHQASLRGVGTDCVGVIRGVWRAVIGPEPEAPPPYPERVDLLAHSILQDYADRHLERLPEGTQPHVGDVAVMRLAAHAPAHHAGIMVAPGRILHAFGGRVVKKVTVGRLSTLLAREGAALVAVYRFPGVV